MLTKEQVDLVFKLVFDGLNKRKKEEHQKLMGVTEDHNWTMIEVQKQKIESLNAIRDKMEDLAYKIYDSEQRMKNINMEQVLELVEVKKEELARLN